MSTQDYSRFGPYAGAMRIVTSMDTDRIIEAIVKELRSYKTQQLLGFSSKEQLQAYLAVANAPLKFPTENKPAEELPCPTEDLPAEGWHFEPMMVGGTIIAWNVCQNDTPLTINRKSDDEQ